MSISGARSAAMPGTDVEATRRRLSARQAETVRHLADATVAELADTGYDRLTVRNVARRAGVAPATAYTYFTSKGHLVAEVFWRRLRALPDTPVDASAPAADRAGAALRDLAVFVASEPALSAACTPALLGADPDVRHLRDRIGTELHRRLAAALAAGSESPGAIADSIDDIVVALDLMVGGALLRAGMGHMSYDDLADALPALAQIVIGDRP
jgi:AcrR family transcriptional regulator